MTDDITAPTPPPVAGEAPPASVETAPPAAEDAAANGALAPEQAQQEEPTPEPVEPEPAPVVESAEEPAAAEATAEQGEPPAAQGEAPAAETPAADEAQPAAVEAPAEAVPSNKHWYVVKVQSGREESIKDAIERRVKIEGLEEFFSQIVIPVEKVREARTNKQGKTTHVVRERKLYPGYLMVEVEFNDRILYLFRETSGVGDFVGGSINRPPPPMAPREVERMLNKQGTGTVDQPVKHKFSKGDRVKVKDGTFAGMEGEIKEVLEAKNLIRVELTIFGRPVPVELEHWQIELL